MKEDFPIYIREGLEEDFLRDFNFACIQLFAYHGLAVTLADSTRDIFNAWQDKAAKWSMYIPERDENPGTLKRRSKPDPSRLSAIKHAGILVDEIYRKKPISTFSPLNIEQKGTLLDVGIPFGAKDSALLEKYPHQSAALSIVDAMFSRYQSIRTDKKGFNWRSPPFSTHYRENMCLMMELGKMNAQSHYMVYKTKDLYGFV